MRWMTWQAIFGRLCPRVASLPTVTRRPRQVSRSVTMPPSRGLHSSTFRLNLNAFCGTGGGACREC